MRHLDARGMADSDGSAAAIVPSLGGKR